MLFFVGWQLKTFQRGFFDREKVIAALDRAERGVLSKFGAFVRRRARSSIRKRKRVSTPGDPPTSRTGLLRKFILFAYDTRRRSVVIGPARLNQKRGQAPSNLEFGGTARAEYSREVIVLPGDPEPPPEAKGLRRRKRRGKTRRYFIRRGDTLRYKPRPYMQPALEKEAPAMPRLYHNSIKP